ncbi:NAD(P)H-binding protein [Puia sp. P3]|uniref:NAD(P)H-binding protein n=1 Tax=Puia sp. P3 TaxID=3423952 RepID=UPI003D677BD4
MKITVTGSLGNVSRVLVGKLTAAGHQVKVVSSNAARAGDIEALGAVPCIGSLTDGEFVARVFSDADRVYTMVPPEFSAVDYYEFADKIHQNYAAAIVQNNVRYAVNLSSIGVAFAGVSPLTRYYDLEKRLNEVSGLNIVHLRPGMFYTNFYGSLGMVKDQGIIGHNIPGTAGILMTHPSDIAEMAYDYLNSLSFSGHSFRSVVSDVKTGNEIAGELGRGIGKALHWVEFPDDALLAGLLQNGFSRDSAETLIVNAGRAIRQGLFDGYKGDKLPGGREFGEFAEEFAVICRA